MINTFTGRQQFTSYNPANERNRVGYITRTQDGQRKKSYLVFVQSGTPNAVQVTFETYKAFQAAGYTVR